MKIFSAFKLSSGSDEHTTDMVCLELDYYWSRLAIARRLSNAVNNIYILYDSLRVESYCLGPFSYFIFKVVIWFLFFKSIYPHIFQPGVDVFLIVICLHIFNLSVHFCLEIIHRVSRCVLLSSIFLKHWFISLSWAVSALVIVFETAVGSISSSVDLIVSAIISSNSLSAPFFVGVFF